MQAGSQAVSKCQKHTICLRAFHKQRKYNLSATVTLCRGKQAKNKKKRDECACYQGPLFNKDNCYATPTFILPSEKIDYIQSTRQFVRDHQKRVREYQQGGAELYVAKPRSQSQYCNVCQQNYEQYIEHIHSSEHRFNLRNSKANDHILQLQHQFSHMHKSTVRLPEGDPRTRNTTQEAEYTGMQGRKKIHVNPQVTSHKNNVPFAQTNPIINLRNPTMNPNNPVFNIGNPTFKINNPTLSLNNSMNHMYGQTYPGFYPPLPPPFFYPPLNQPYGMPMGFGQVPGPMYPQGVMGYPWMYMPYPPSMNVQMRPQHFY